jgi:hypothetical protein
MSRKRHARGKMVVAAQLAWIAGERGYKPGWVAYQFRERFGIWASNNGRADTGNPFLGSVARHRICQIDAGR